MSFNEGETQGEAERIYYLGFTVAKRVNPPGMT